MAGIAGSRPPIHGRSIGRLDASPHSVRVLICKRRLEAAAHLAIRPGRPSCHRRRSQSPVRRRPSARHSPCRRRQPQSVSFFESADSPVTVGLVIDSSVSMQRRRESVIAAGIAFAESSDRTMRCLRCTSTRRSGAACRQGRCSRATAKSCDTRSSGRRRGQTAIVRSAWR